MKRGRFISTLVAVDFQKLSSECLNIAAAGVKNGDVEAGIPLTIFPNIRRRFAAAEPDVDILFINIEVNKHGRHLLAVIFCTGKPFFSQYSAYARFPKLKD